MTRTLYDALGQHATSIPRGAQMVAGYADGDFKWSAADYAMFPRAARLAITVAAQVPDSHDASVIDVETGAFTPHDARGFVVARTAYRPAGLAAVYCNLSTLPAVRKACRGLAYGIWLAHYTDRPPAAPEPAWGPDVVAVQWRNGDTTGVEYDQSVVFDADWHPQP
jgi:hypothetical protein